MNLSGQTIWITGASSGIGHALALELARRGASLALTARRREQLEGLAREITASGAKAIVVPGDVTNLEQMKACRQVIAKEFPKVDMLIANAGTNIESNPENFSTKDYMTLMGINYGGMLNSIEAILPSMLQQSSGTIVGVASLAGLRGLPTAAGYGASKAAIINFLESIRFHLRHRGIGVVIINPGFVKTPLTDKNKFPMPFLLSAEQSANYICDGLERDKKKITYPWLFSTFLEVARILPYPIYEFLAERAWRKM